MRFRIAMLLTVGSLSSSSLARAHFKLVAPASMSEQNGAGDPQKRPPCGLSDSATNPDTSVRTNAVTVVPPGSMLTISIDEKVPHPGHYRVAIAQDLASLPADPPVTAGATGCGSTVIESSPTLPLLADGLFLHSGTLNGTQSVQVQLPPGMTCDHCVLQVIEFMSNHLVASPGGCFYHHCATITIAANAPDAGVPPTDDAGVNPTAPKPGGCCDSSGGGAATGLLGMAALGLVIARRRRR